MNRVYWLLWFLFFTIGCSISKNSYGYLSSQLKFIKSNFNYDNTRKIHSMSQILIDTFIAQHEKTFEALVGLDSSKVKSILGVPDSHIKVTEFGYRLGKYPNNPKCEMFLHIVLTAEGFCKKTKLAYDCDDGIMPNNGIKSIPNK